MTKEIYVSDLLFKDTRQKSPEEAKLYLERMERARQQQLERKEARITIFNCTECETVYDLDDYVYCGTKKTCVEKQLCWSCAYKITPRSLSEF